MNFSHRAFWLAGLLFVAMLAAPPAFAKSDRHGPPILALRYAEQLGLDADTQSRLQEIVSQSRDRKEELRARLHDARRETGRLLQASTLDEAAVMAQADEVNAIKAEIEKNRLQAILDIRKLLTPEQRQALVELALEHAPHEGRERGPRHRPALASCRRDQRKHCPEATDGPPVLACLQEHWSALSDECRTAFDFSNRPGPPRHPGPPPSGRPPR